MDVLTELEQYVSGLDKEQKQELDALLVPELQALWLPDPRNQPQVDAYYSQADLMLYGGAVGGGKSDLLVGLALTAHKRSVIFRRQATDLRDIEERIVQLAGRDGWNGQNKILRRGEQIIELGHLEKPGSEKTWQGRGHDLIGFDEGAQLARNKVQFILGWLRSVDPGQRRRAVIASNPPTGGAEGLWLVEWFAPWLDPASREPALPGELRWAAIAPDQDGTTVWVKDGSPIVFVDHADYRNATPEEIAREDEAVVTPLTRTFIPSKLANNPYLANSGYRAQVQALPEPLRSQMLHGDFLAGQQDNERQVIPTAWITAAQARWRNEVPKSAMTAIGVDVAEGGSARTDKTVLAARYGGWYAPLVRKPGNETQEGSDVAALVVRSRRNNCPVVVDVGGGFGAAAVGALERNGIPTVAYKGLDTSAATSREGKLKFFNRRAEDWWRFREELDPDQEFGSAIALPPDASIKADLASARWELTPRGIKIELKAEIKKRLGHSPDDGDAIVMAMAPGARAAARLIREGRQGGRQERANVGHEQFKSRFR